MLLSKSGPLEWPGTLFEYQIEGIKALTAHDALLLADDMGLGKTIQAVGALRILFLQRFIESCLLIVPGRSYQPVEKRTASLGPGIADLNY